MERIRYPRVAPGAVHAMNGLGNYVKSAGLEPSLLDLVKLRASQINGCAYCVDMHWKDARAAGETEQRLYGVSVWRESPYYTERERAALAWAEALTRIAEDEISDELYEETRKHFDEKALVDLSLAIVEINGWNRLAKTFRTVPGNYQPAARPAVAAPATPGVKG